MSLVALLSDQAIKDRFKQSFVKPKVDIELVTKAEPLSQRFSLVGTAFDYLLRFLIKYVNSMAIEHTWTAEKPLMNASPLITKNAIYDPATDSFEFEHTPISRKVESIIKNARMHYTSYLSGGVVSEDLLRASLQLAQIDAIYRRGYIDPEMGQVYQEDVDDLRRLLSLVPSESFHAKTLAILNPTFGDASHKIGGADADLIIDDCLIELKVSKKPEFTLATFYQIMGYLLLSEIGGIDGAPKGFHLKNGGVYFARQAYLFRFELSDIVQEGTLKKMTEWFARNYCQTGKG